MSSTQSWTKGYQLETNTMGYECACGWTFVGDEGQMLARIEHYLSEHADDPEQVFEGTNLELLQHAHTALFEIDEKELDGWYASQVDRIRRDIDEIVRREVGPEAGKHPYWDNTTRLGTSEE